jgi:hypothetical protein
MQHMREVLRANKASLDKRINIFERGRRFSSLRKQYLLELDKKLDNVEISKEELAVIRLVIVKKRKKETMITLMVWTITFLTAITAAYIFKDKLFPSPGTHKNETVVDLNKFNSCINNGDRWLRKNHWHNAIFQYEEAQKILPNDSLILRRLAIAYTYQCREKRMGCEKAFEKIEVLIERAPTRGNYELLASYYYGIGDSTNAVSALEMSSQLMN